MEQLNLERGLGFTIKKLFVDPRGAMHEFLFENRRPYVKPLPLLLLITGLTVFITFQFMGLEVELIKSSARIETMVAQLSPSLREVVRTFMRFLSQYFNVALMAALPFAALMTYWIFPDHRLYYTEHLVINTYIYCIQSIFTILILPFLRSTPALASILVPLTLAYMVYAITRIFEQNWWAGLLKTLAVYLGAQAMYNIFILLLLLSMWALS